MTQQATAANRSRRQAARPPEDLEGLLSYRDEQGAAVLVPRWMALRHIATQAVYYRGRLAVPPALLQAFGAVPRIGMPLFVISTVWMVVAMLVAVRQVLDYSSVWRPIAVCLTGLLLALIFVSHHWLRVRAVGVLKLRVNPFA